MCRLEMASWFDATIWVHTRAEVACRRVAARGVDTAQVIDDWMIEENAFLDADQPWTRAICSSTASSVVIHETANTETSLLPLAPPQATPVWRRWWSRRSPESR